MLLILMYHRVHGVASGPKALENHLHYLRDNYPLVLPGDSINAANVSVCLTFDDATVDFYYQVFPLLNKLAIPALVAVPTAWIIDDTTLPVPQRLIIQAKIASNENGNYGAERNSLCTWNELRTMQTSGLVRCAAHGHNHLDMSAATTDVNQEINLSYEALRLHLGIAPDTFVYPYGRTKQQNQSQVKQIFPHAMRIGSAINRDWSGNNGLLYRVDAELFWPNKPNWSFTDAVRWRIKYLVNRIRDK